MNALFVVPLLLTALVAGAFATRTVRFETTHFGEMIDGVYNPDYCEMDENGNDVRPPHGACFGGFSDTDVILAKRTYFVSPNGNYHVIWDTPLKGPPDRIARIKRWQNWMAEQDEIAKYPMSELTAAQKMAALQAANAPWCKQPRHHCFYGYGKRDSDTRPKDGDAKQGSTRE